MADTRKWGFANSHWTSTAKRTRTLIKCWMLDPLQLGHNVNRASLWRQTTYWHRGRVPREDPYLATMPLGA